MAFVSPVNTSFSISLANPLVIQTDIFNAWLNGKNDTEAAAIFASKRNLPLESELFSIVQSQFRTFELLELHLSRPRYFIDQCLFPLPLEIKRTLLELYYSFDWNVARELLDKKMASRGRRDLDEICTLTQQPLASIRRQFEILRRMQKRVEDLPGNLASNIQRKFLLSKSLSAKYTLVLFLLKHRIEVGRKKLPISSEVLFESIEPIYTYLTLTNATADLDHTLAKDIRELRSLGLGLEAQVLLKAFIRDDYDREEFHLKLTHSILTIGSGLSQAKEIKDILLDIYDELCKPILENGLCRSEVEKVFDILLKLPNNFKALEENASNYAKLLTSWERLITALKHTSLTMIS